MNLKIYTKKPHNYFSKEFVKEIGRFIFRKSRGPQAVIDSLVRGLSELDGDFSLNNKKPKLDGTETFFVNSSIDALRWGIKLKRDEKIKKLIAGPNLVILPGDSNGIINSPEIDKILVPSDWVRRSWLASNFLYIDKVIIWPSGIFDFGVSNNKKDKILLYTKNIPDDIYLMVKNILSSLNVAYEEIIYGKFLREDYFKKLDKSYCLIYLQESESQGLGLLEAWMKNVPTFVYNYGKWQRDGIVVKGDDVSAPYLNSLSGSLFRDENDLKNLLLDVVENNKKYRPREYYLNNFTDKICVQKFLDIIK